jgi:ubiquinone/menaquinone biosynthesis C-methylase UbiE
VPRGPDLTSSHRKYETLLAVDRLFLSGGETVIAVACGTGLNFSALETAVGHRGRVLGIDASAEMIEMAGERVRGRGWTNVELIKAAIEQTRFQARADGALFSFTHDVLQSPIAIDNVIRHLAHLAPGSQPSEPSTHRPGPCAPT